MKKLNQLALLASVLSCVAPFVSAGEQHGSKANSQSHAPIGVMADHMHKSGEWMFSYRYMYMEMEGNRDGTNSISPDEIILGSKHIWNADEFARRSNQNDHGYAYVRCYVCAQRQL